MSAHKDPVKNPRLTCTKCEGEWTMHGVVDIGDKSIFWYCPWCGTVLNILREPKKEVKTSEDNMF